MSKSFLKFYNLCVSRQVLQGKTEKMAPLAQLDNPESMDKMDKTDKPEIQVLLVLVVLRELVALLDRTDQVYPSTFQFNSEVNSYIKLIDFYRRHSWSSWNGWNQWRPWRPWHPGIARRSGYSRCGWTRYIYKLEFL